MGYWIGKPYWGMGYATEAARALILHAFHKERFDYLTVGHFKENPASARVIAKLGFEPSGEVLRDCAARNNKARCLTYRLTRERGLASLRPGQEASPLSAAGRGLG
jgi:RimJ/RimL family protein N-acetyltransferase